MDINAELEAGMSWRRFCVLLSGLGAESRWHLSMRAEKDKPRVLEGASAESWFRARATEQKRRAG
jgi:hypothetical protein